MNALCVPANFMFAFDTLPRFPVVYSFWRPDAISANELRSKQNPPLKGTVSHPISSGKMVFFKKNTLQLVTCTFPIWHIFDTASKTDLTQTIKLAQIEETWFFFLQLSHSNTVNNETCAGGRWRWRAKGVFFTAAESGKGGRREKFCSLLLLPLLSHPSIKILLLLFLFSFNVTQILGDLERGGRRETQVRHALLLSSNLKPNFTNIFPQKSSSASTGSFKITSSWFRLRFALFHTLSQTDPRRKVHFQLDLFPKPIWGKRGHRRRIFSSFFLPSLSIFPGSKKRGGRRKRRCNLQQYNWCSGWGKGKSPCRVFFYNGRRWEIKVGAEHHALTPQTATVR